MKKLITIALVVLMALSVVACSNQAKKEEVADPNSIVGTWTLDFEAMMAELGEEERAFMEMMGVNADSYQMNYVFNADGTGSISMNAFGQSEEAAFTYTAQDGKLEMTATIDGETNTTTAEYQIDNGTLLLTQEGETVAFKRK